MRDKRGGREVKEKKRMPHFIVVIQGDEHDTWSRDGEIYAHECNKVGLIIWCD